MGVIVHSSALRILPFENRKMEITLRRTNPSIIDKNKYKT